MDDVIVALGSGHTRRCWGYRIHILVAGVNKYTGSRRIIIQANHDSMGVRRRHGLNAKKMGFMYTSLQLNLVHFNL